MIPKILVSTPISPITPRIGKPSETSLNDIIMRPKTGFLAYIIYLIRPSGTKII